MSVGTFYSIGIGPGDPDLVTVKGAKILSQCRHVFVPKPRAAHESVALAIARRHINTEAAVHELIFPMTSCQDELSNRWKENASAIAAVLVKGEDACFITLGDPCLYSTGIYLVRELRKLMPDARIVTVPGITSFSAASALVGFPVGEGKHSIMIIPVDDNLDQVRSSLQQPGTVVLMKIGERLHAILDLLEKCGRIEGSVFIARAGMEDERVETDLRLLRNASQEAGYLSIILVPAKEEKTL
jgi:precorrin-2/cobalt-factor-2 C20-methyltransferase